MSNLYHAGRFSAMSGLSLTIGTIYGYVFHNIVYVYQLYQLTISYKYRLLVIL